MGEERETSIDVTEKHRQVACRTCLDWGLNHNLGMCPDQGLNSKTFGVWEDALTN